MSNVRIILSNPRRSVLLAEVLFYNYMYTVVKMAFQTVNRQLVMYQDS